MSYSAAIREGREVPHRRHWRALLELTKEVEDRLRREREFEAKWEDVNYQEDIQPGLEDAKVETIVEATGLSYGYSRKIRSGSVVPAREHWATLNELRS